MSELGQNRKSSRRAHVFRFGPESGHRMSVMSTHPGSIDAAMPAASWFWAGVIRVDDALGGAARRRHVALCQRGIGAFEVIVFPALVDLQADRIVRIIRLSPSRRRCRSHPNCQNRQSQNAHRKLFMSALVLWRETRFLLGAGGGTRTHTTLPSRD